MPCSLSWPARAGQGRPMNARSEGGALTTWGPAGPGPPAVLGSIVDSGPETAVTRGCRGARHGGRPVAGAVRHAAHDPRRPARLAPRSRNDRCGIEAEPRQCRPGVEARGSELAPPLAHRPRDRPLIFGEQRRRGRVPEHLPVAACRAGGTLPLGGVTGPDKMPAMAYDEGLAQRIREVRSEERRVGKE